MGALFDYSTRAPAVPAPINGAVHQYHASSKAWESQSKRVKNCASSIDLLFKDVTRLNLLLRFLKSPHNDLVLKMRLFTCVDIDSKLSKLLWKFNNNTVIRCDVVNIQSLPPLSIKDKCELSRPSHPHQTPGINQQKNEPEVEHKAAPNKKEIQIEASYTLGIYEFYYLFLFLEDKLPELAAWLMKQSQHNEHNVLLKVLSNKVSLLNKGDANDHNPLINENDIEEEEKKEANVSNQMMMEQQKKMINPNLERNEIEDEHCIICFEKMKDPVVLKCSHEFCKDCIDDWQKQIGGKDCPICRCIIEQSQMWVKLDSQDFSKAQYMMDLLKFPFEYIKHFEKWE
eukprot:55700_1